MKLVQELQQREKELAAAIERCQVGLVSVDIGGHNFVRLCGNHEQNGVRPVDKTHGADRSAETELVVDLIRLMLEKRLAEVRVGLERVLAQQDAPRVYRTKTVESALEHGQGMAKDAAMPVPPNLGQVGRRFPAPEDGEM